MKVTVYDESNKAHEKESVDAKECVEILGWTMEPKELKKAAKSKAADKVVEEKQEGEAE